MKLVSDNLTNKDFLDQLSINFKIIMCTIKIIK